MIATLSARRPVMREIIGQAEGMGIRVAGAAMAIVTGLSVLTSTPSSADSDEDQVRAVLNGMNASYNRTDFGTFASHLCADMLRAAGLEAGWYASRKSDGPTQITINSVEVTGADAVANVRFEAANHADAKTLDVGFLREGGEWKACRYDAGRSV